MEPFSLWAQISKHGRFCRPLPPVPVKGRFAYENQNESPDLRVNRGDDSDGGACRAGGGTDFLRRYSARMLHGYLPGRGRPRHPAAGRHDSRDPHNRHGNCHPPGSILIDREVTGNLTNFTASGSAHWIAANRDQIHTTVFGQAEFSDQYGGSLKVTEIHIITGGTGRLSGAQGSFTVVLFHKLEVSGVSGGVETHAISGTFHGTITSAR